MFRNLASSFQTCFNFSKRKKDLQLEFTVSVFLPSLKYSPFSRWAVSTLRFCICAISIFHDHGFCMLSQSEWNDRDSAASFPANLLKFSKSYEIYNRDFTFPEPFRCSPRSLLVSLLTCYTFLLLAVFNIVCKSLRSNFRVLSQRKWSRNDSPRKDRSTFDGVSFQATRDITIAPWRMTKGRYRAARNAMPFLDLSRSF